jgi:hypothetical protein
MAIRCECCNYVTYKKYNMDKHLTSKRHLSRVPETVPVLEPAVPEKKEHVCKHCDKKFTFKQAMYRHMKTACKKTDIADINAVFDSAEAVVARRLKQVDYLRKIYLELGEIIMEEQLEIKDFVKMIKTTMQKKLEIR